MAFNSFFSPRGSSSFDRRNGDPAYARDRQAIDLKLKGRFERIFEKYAKDFSDVGDEVDIETGQVVVNNGHLTHMQHERDTGKSASAQFVRDFAKELDEEADTGDDEDTDGGEDDADPDAEDEGSGGEEEDHQTLHQPDHQDKDDDELALDPLLAQQDRVAIGNTDSQSIVESTEAVSPLPPISIDHSLNSLVPHQDASGRIDPAAIHALGQNIANQIAQFLMGATSARPNPRSYSAWDAPPLPSDAFSHTSFFNHHRDETPLPERYPSVLESPSAGHSIWAPAESRNKRRKLIQHTTSHHERDSDLSDDSLQRSSQKRFYSRDEDEMIKRLRDVNGMTWSQITTYMPGRTAGAVSARYTRALKHLSRPVIVKREVIEIMDGEDDIPGTPDHASIPGNVPGSGPQAFVSPRRPPPRTPLLRQALENQIAKHGDTGDLPITIGDDGNDTDSQRASSVETSGYSRPDDHNGFYQDHDNLRHNLYSRGSSSAEEAQAGQERRQASRYHQKPETHPRYNMFTTSDDVGRFGILKMRNPTPMNSTPQDQILGPRYATSGAFGILRVAKEKPAKQPPAPKAAKAPKQAGEPKRSRKPKKPSKAAESRAHAQFKMPKKPRKSNDPQESQELSHQDHQVESESSSASIGTPMQHRGVSEELTVDTPSYVGAFENRNSLHPTNAEQDEGNDGDVSEPEVTETPARTRYMDADESAASNGPYFLSNIPARVTAHEPGRVADVFTSPHSVEGGPLPQHLQPPSSPPPLPTPRSDISAKSSLRRSMRQQPKRDMTSHVGPAPVAKMVPSGPPKDSQAIPRTPIRNSLATKAERPSTVSRTTAVDYDGESEDELAL